MNHRSSPDRELWIPTLIAGFSVIGIIVVLFIGRSLNAPAEVAATPSSTPFQYVYLGTEPAITTLVVDGSELPPTPEPVEEFPIGEGPIATQRIITPVILTQPGAVTVTVNAPRTNTPPPTSTSASGPPLNPGTYDDIDSHLLYSGAWMAQPVIEAKGGTLHVSLAPSTTSTITFRFIGRQLRLVYLGGSTLGRLTVKIDTETETLDQSTGNEWVSELYENGTHTVVITHSGGGSVNLDQVIIPEVPVTPTRTPTLSF